MYNNRFGTLSSGMPFKVNKHVVVRAFDSSLVSDYTVNSCGYLRSDFSELNERNDSLSMARLLARLQEVSEDDSNKGKSFEELLDMLRPRSCQTPAELDRFEQYCIDKALDFYNNLKKSEVAKLSVGEGGEKSTPTPPSSSAPASSE